jgi:hypothetical protein
MNFRAGNVYARLAQEELLDAIQRNNNAVLFFFFFGLYI